MPLTTTDINLSVADDGLGDRPRAAGLKINANFAAVKALLDSTEVTVDANVNLIDDNADAVDDHEWRLDDLEGEIDALDVVVGDLNTEMGALDLALTGAEADIELNKGSFEDEAGASITINDGESNKLYRANGSLAQAFAIHSPAYGSGNLLCFAKDSTVTGDLTLTCTGSFVSGGEVVASLVLLPGESVTLRKLGANSWHVTSATSLVVELAPSTEELVPNVTFEGNPVYRQTFSGTLPTPASGFAQTYLSDVVDTLIDANVRMKADLGSGSTTRYVRMTHTNNTLEVQVRHIITSAPANVIQVFADSLTSEFDGQPYAIDLMYTKL